MTFQTYSEIGLVPDALYEFNEFDRDNPLPVPNKGSDPFFSPALPLIFDSGAPFRPNTNPADKGGRGTLLGQQDFFNRDGFMVPFTNISGAFTIIGQIVILRPTTAPAENVFGVSKPSGDGFTLTGFASQEFRVRRIQPGSVLAVFGLQNVVRRHPTFLSNNIQAFALRQNSAREMSMRLNGITLTSPATDANDYSIDGALFIQGGTPIGAMSLSFFNTDLDDADIDLIANDGIGTFGV